MHVHYYLEWSGNLVSPPFCHRIISLVSAMYAPLLVGQYAYLDAETQYHSDVLLCIISYMKKWAC